MNKYVLSLLVLSCFTFDEAAAGKQKLLLSVGDVHVYQEGEICRTYKVPDPRYPKLQCEGYNCATVSQHVNSVKCTAEGRNDMGEMSWGCKGEIPKGCHFGKVEVSCEGFQGLDSGYIVPGSCGLTYSLDCDRMDDAQSEEQQQRKKIKQQREEQQILKYKRLEEIEGMEASHKCKIAVAGALHEPGDDVELNSYGGWVKGIVTEINCDGTYQFQPEYESRVHSYVNESQLRTWVATIYKNRVNPSARGMRHRSGATWTAEDEIAERCGEPLCSNHGRCPHQGPCICDELYYGPHCENKEMTFQEKIMAGVIGFIFLVVAYFAGGGKNQQRASHNAYSKAPVYNRASDGPPEVDHQAMDEKRAVLDKIKATKAKLRIAKVMAENDVERKAALDKYNTEMDQLQRDVQNDTMQLGNAMQRVDHVLDRYEAVGYANTTIR